MHAREFVKPQPIQLKHPQAPADAKAVTYSFEDYLGEFVWGYAKWNTEDGWDESQIRLGDVIERTEPGQVVRIEELDDWERLREANKAAELRGVFAPKLRKMQRAIKSAHKPTDS